METINTKTYKCKVIERWYWSLENASITIITPKGTALRISKWPPAALVNKWDKNELAAKLVWHVYEESLKDANGVMLTADEIILWESVCDTQGKNAPGMHEASKSNMHVMGGCQHKNMREKNHGTWVGWHCPDCGQGGSRNISTYKKRKKYY